MNAISVRIHALNILRITKVINAQQSNTDIQALWSADWNHTLSTYTLNRTPWKSHSLVLHDWLYFPLKCLWMNVMLMKMIPRYISLGKLEWCYCIRGREPLALEKVQQRLIGSSWISDPKFIEETCCNKEKLMMSGFCINVENWSMNYPLVWHYAVNYFYNCA